MRLPSRLIRFVLILFVTALVTIATPMIATAQIPFAVGGGSGETLGNTPWWDVNKARRCGRLWCSDVYLRGSLFRRITIARFPDEEETAKKNAIAIEDRAQEVESVFNEVYGQLVRLEPVVEDQINVSLLWRKLQRDRAKGQGQAAAQQQSSILNLDPPPLPPAGKKSTTDPTPEATVAPDPPPLSSIFTDPENNKLDIHPLTPKVVVGIKNGQTVIFMPEQEALGIAPQTLVTVNEADEIANGKLVEELAFEWRDYIRTCFDAALWANELDLQYPWARYQVAVLMVILVSIPIALMAVVRSLLHKQNRILRQQLRQLTKSLTKDTEAEALKGLKQDIDAAAENNGTENFDSVDDENPNVSTAVVSPPENDTTPKLSSWHQRFPTLYRLLYLLPFADRLSAVKASVTETLQSIGDLATFNLRRQSLIRQRQNVVNLCSMTLLWLQISCIFLLVASVVFIFPIMRPYTVLFFGQAMFCPLLWIIITIVDKTAGIAIDGFLNNWANEQQLFNPESNRYTLRVATYSPAIKGAVSVLLILVGLLGTIWLFGINPIVLASFGGVAFVVAFLGRNVVEDMLNGALILATDRYAMGDVIKVGEISGLVENMNIYITQLRGAEGRLSTIPNGQISIVENLTKDWSRAEFVVEIDQTNDIEGTLQVIKEVSEKMRQDDQWQEKVIEPAIILGVDNIASQGIKLQVWIKTQPGQHWGVGREFRLRVKKAFEREGIGLAVPRQQVVYHTKTSATNDSPLPGAAPLPDTN